MELLLKQDRSRPIMIEVRDLSCRTLFTLHNPRATYLFTRTWLQKLMIRYDSHAGKVKTYNCLQDIFTLLLILGFV